MSRLSRSTCLLAVVAMLLHATLLVRHHGFALQSSLTHQSLVASLLEICAGGEAKQLASSDIPTLPAHGKHADTCPLCMGMGSVVAVTSEGPVLVLPTAYVSARIGVVAEILTRRLPAATPPIRGPPAYV